MSHPVIKWVESARSTNSLIASMADSDPQAPHGLTVAARCQTAGRGQRGNSWEAEPGMNLTFSVLLRPEAIAASSQFDLSTAVALAVADIVAAELPAGMAPRVKVKWPNDIYVDNLKICGILIENVLSGSSICRSIAGVGINVNQERFLSDAPNPVSLTALTGRRHDLDALLVRVAGAIVGRVDSCSRPDALAAMRADYFNRLWRADGALHRWRDNADGSEFEAAVTAVAPSGLLSLTCADSTVREFAFKEVTPL